MFILVGFLREPSEDIEVVEASKIKGRTMLDKQQKQLAIELNQCHEIRGTYKFTSRTDTGGKFIVEFSFTSDSGNEKVLLQRLLQYAYERYGWAGRFEIL